MCNSIVLTSKWYFSIENHTFNKRISIFYFYIFNSLKEYVYLQL